MISTFHNLSQYFILSGQIWNDSDNDITPTCDMYIVHCSV